MCEVAESKPFSFSLSDMATLIVSSTVIAWIWATHLHTKRNFHIHHICVRKSTLIRALFVDAQKKKKNCSQSVGTIALWQTAISTFSRAPYYVFVKRSCFSDVAHFENYNVRLEGAGRRIICTHKKSVNIF